ncbi:hypothetical protein ATANTOWER_003960 [Ataeniobius toweri]|uniref:Uncharacterized protein n=1 Tax=Ataeniobius toweri TaxID=208326 RepID=A0ABU7B5E8_9TELE|nr:hypothetical protein [Ataeniobius toweri]
MSVKIHFPGIALNSSRCMFDICLSAVPRGILGQRCETKKEIAHMFWLLPLSPRLFHSVCCRFINVSEPSISLSPQKPCCRLSLLRARYGGGLCQGREPLRGGGIKNLKAA